jgi:hypothetical protein
LPVRGAALEGRPRVKEKQKNPYQRLLESLGKYRGSVKYPKTKTMWTYPKNKLGEGWTLAGLYERVSAADQLGFDVVLTADDAGIRVSYRARPDESHLPWSVR